MCVFSGGLVSNHHLSVSEDSLSVVFENHLLHHKRSTAPSVRNLVKMESGR